MSVPAEKFTAKLRSGLRGLFRDARLGLFSGWLSLRRPFSRLAPVTEGVTVVITSWNTIKYLRVAMAAVTDFSPDDVEILVVDNCSADGSPDLLAVRYPRTRVLSLRRNVGHGLAVDFAIHKARTTDIVILDVDAFPISATWIDRVVEPLRNGHTLAGAEHCGYVHPCYMALKRDHFLRSGHTFDAIYSRRLRIKRRDWPEFWDAGQLVTFRDSGTHHYITPTSVRGPHALGVVFGDVVYHNFYSTQGANGQVTREQAEEAWNAAVSEHLAHIPAAALN